MDGFSVQAAHEVVPGVTPFAVAGAFPLFNTLINYPNNGAGQLAPLSPGSNLPSHDKYLFAGQLGMGIKIDPQTSFKFGAAYYHFENVQGELASPCDAQLAANVCSTALLRPSFAQYGNPYMGLRSAIDQAPSGVPLP